MHKHLNCFLLYILIFTLLPGFALGQQKDIKDFFKVGGDVYTAPLHFENDDWIKLSALAAAATGAYFLDKPVKSLFLRNKNATADFVTNIDKYFYIEGVAISIAGIYGYGLAADDNDMKRLGLRLAEATFYASSIQVLTKVLVGRKRPNCDCGPFSFDPFTVDVEHSSMPSAHSTLAFAFSTVMANYKDNTLWKVTWYTLSSLVALSRIYHNMHWFSDVIVGSALGYFVGEFVNNHDTNKDVAVMPGIPPVNLVSLRIAL